MKTTIAALTAALCMGFGVAAIAQTSSSTTSPSSSGSSSSMSSPSTSSMPSAGAMTKADQKAAKKQADGDYKAAKAKCKPMKGDEKKACDKDAKAAHEKALADIKHASAEAKKG